jgi:transcriptional regulator with XRE-family HTH domain
MTQVARELGIPRTTLIGIRNGQHAPGLATMDRVQAALPEYTVDYLFPREQPEEDDRDRVTTAAG